MSNLVADRNLPRIIAIANQKGGVGKTTTAVNLGTALAAVGQKVLLIDLDPQGNASTGLGVNPRDRRLTIYDVIAEGVALERVLVETVAPGLHVAPSSVDLSGIDIELIEDADRVQRLRDALTVLCAAPSAPAFSYILIDCPPALNLLTVNAMVAADTVMVPLQCEFFALEGLSQLLGTVERVKQTLNRRLSIEGIVLTMFDRRNNLSIQVAEDVRETLGDLVYETVIPRNVRLSEAPSYGKPAILYDHACAGSQAYIGLAGEVLRRAADVSWAK